MFHLYLRYNTRIKTFSLYRVFVLGKISSLVSCLLVKLEPTRVKHLSGALLYVRLLALPTKIQTKVEKITRVKNSRLFLFTKQTKYTNY